MDMMNILCWLGFVFMVIGFASFVVGFVFLFDPLAWFMVGVLLDHVVHHISK